MPAKKRSSKPWNKPNPRGKAKRKKLSPSAKGSAKARAARAGRAYPNLVDNMRAAAKGGRRGKGRKAQSRRKAK